MTKLEEKLIELGYESDSKYMYCKSLDRCYILIIIYENMIINYGVSSTDFICHNEDIDNLQQAYNEMHKDLEVLKEYENDK